MQLALLAAGGSFWADFADAYKEHPIFLTINFLCLAVVVVIILERILFQTRNYRVNSTEFFSQIKKLVLAGNIDRAIKLCEARDFPVLELVKSGLTNSNKGPDDIDAALSESLAELKPQVEKRIGALWSLANIATLIGLLGTVAGLITTFAAIAEPGLTEETKQRMLSAGISEAMYNTALGLGIAVICMVAHLWLHNRGKTITHDLETTMEKTFNLLTVHTGRA